VLLGREGFARRGTASKARIGRRGFRGPGAWLRRPGERADRPPPPLGRAVPTKRTGLSFIGRTKGERADRFDRPVHKRSVTAATWQKPT